MTVLNYAPAVSGLLCVNQGKVRDTFAIPDPTLLLAVATNRISTHDIIHNSEVPGKGAVLTALTTFWMTQQLSGIRNHLVASGEDIFNYLPTQEYPEDLAQRALIIQKLDMIPVEFIFRSRMAGSLWKKFYSQGKENPYGLILPPGLQLMSPFPETVFTPTDKSATDDPIDAAATRKQYPEAYTLALRAYELGREYAASAGIAIIDGKFEVGIDSNGDPVLADECLTPDCCRFVSMSGIFVGQEPDWLDKQFLREEAEREWAGGKKFPVTFSQAAIAETASRYSGILSALAHRI